MWELWGVEFSALPIVCVIVFVFLFSVTLHSLYGK